MSKPVPLGNRLRYPITIHKLLIKPGETISKRQVLFQYTYENTKESGDIVRGAVITKYKAYADWESPVEGKLKHWRIKEGAVITRDQPGFEIEEECSHAVQFSGLCAMCGKDVTEVDFSQEAADESRATVAMIHDQNNLRISADLAQKEEERMQRRLLEQRKLVLVVDLDQTIIHACIDPTVGDWLRDPSNPNYESLKDVGRFQLEDHRDSQLSSCWYYIKKRPGLDGFLERMAKLFEMHVYTMGTRPYAVQVAKVVDPDKKLFSNRVISRDETGSLQKELSRLFPNNTDMVVIIDDRSDVWPNDRQNLIRVTPFDFFKGIGDINSSFLPQRTDMLPTMDNREKAEAQSAIKSIEVDDKTEEEIESQAISEQEKELNSQLENRPLAHLQEDAEVSTPDEAAAAVSDTPSTSAAVLRNNDCELENIERHLAEVHARFYNEYDRLNRLYGDLSGVNIGAVPDIGELLRQQKRQVLAGTVICLSGLVATNILPFQSELGLQIQAFGATLVNKITDKVTHLVVNRSRSRTDKLKQALKVPRIMVVGSEWLADCFSKWQHVDEYSYLLDLAPRVEGEDEEMMGIVAGEDGVSEEEDKEGDDEGEEMDDEQIVLNDLAGFQAGDADDELAEFLASDSDGDDGDDDGAGAVEDPEQPSLKRKASSTSVTDPLNPSSFATTGNHKSVAPVNHPMFKRLRLAPRRGDGEGRSGTATPVVEDAVFAADLEAEMAKDLEMALEEEEKKVREEKAREEWEESMMLEEWMMLEKWQGGRSSGGE